MPLQGGERSYNDFGVTAGSLVRQKHSRPCVLQTPRAFSFNSAGSGIACLIRVDRGERAWPTSSTNKWAKSAGAANFPSQHGDRTLSMLDPRPAKQGKRAQSTNTGPCKSTPNEGSRINDTPQTAVIQFPNTIA